ncbi:WD40 repeat domain-containing protein, partial [bacterium]|nr:WD40 repeat domain-containing protein [bacterium]
DLHRPTQAPKTLRETTRNEDAIFSTAFSPEGRYMAAGTRKGNLLLWRIVAGTPVELTPIGEKLKLRKDKAAHQLKFSPRGEKLLVLNHLSGASGPEVLDMATGKTVTVFNFRNNHKDLIHFFAGAFGDENTVFLLSEKEFVVADASTGEELRRYRWNAGFKSLTAARDGSRIVVGTKDGRVLVVSAAWLRESQAEAQ